MSERRALAPALLLALASPAAAAEVSVLALPFRVAEFRGPESYLARILPSADPALRQPRREGPLAIAWGEGGAAALVLEGGAVTAVPLKGNPANLGERPNDAIPNGRQQASGPLKAYFAVPRASGPAGPGAGTLVIEERRPVAPSGGVQKVPVSVTRLEAGPDAAYADLEPRLADLDGDGAPEILAVRAAASGDAVLIVAGKRDGAWRVLAEMPAGEAKGWLNSGPVADLDRDGRPDLVVVRAPHAEGRLQVWAYAAGALRLAHEKAGYSSHAPGSSALDNAAAVDLDGDGAPEIVVPTLDRSSLAVLTARGRLDERARIPLPSPAGRGVAALGSGKAARIVVALADGRIAVVRP